MQTTTRIPKYLKIKNELVTQITSGVYKSGDVIPSDNELMRTLNVSKSTITQALKLLETEGYITRLQGKGSFVTDRKNSKTVLNIYICPIEQNERNFWEDIITHFNEDNPDFSVQPTFLYNENAPLRDILFQSFASGNAPDLFSLDGPDVAYWAYMNSLLPFDDYLDKKFLNSFLDPILNQGHYRGKLYHLGYMESSLCILYNKELFSSLGIRIPTSTEDAWSWDEFLKICEEIRQKTSYPYPLLMDSGKGLSPKSGEWLSYSGLPFILQNKGRIFNKDYTKATGYLNSIESIQAMQWLGDLFRKYHYTHIEKLSDSLPENFAMSLSLPSAYFQNSIDNSNVGILPLPKGVQSASPHGSWGLCMSRQTRYPEYCCRFVRYVFSLKNQLQISKYTGIPVLKEIYEVMENFNTMSTDIHVLFSQLKKTSFTRPQTPAYPFFSKYFAYAYYNIANGADAKAELDQLSSMVDDHLYRHGYFQMGE